MFGEIAKIAKVSESAPVWHCQFWIHDAGDPNSRLRATTRSLDELVSELMSLSLAGYSIEYVRYTLNARPTTTSMWIALRKMDNTETNIDGDVIAEVAKIKWAKRM